MAQVKSPQYENTYDKVQEIYTQRHSGESTTGVKVMYFEKPLGTALQAADYLVLDRFPANSILLGMETSEAADGFLYYVATDDDGLLASTAVRGNAIAQTNGGKVRGFPVRINQDAEGFLAWSPTANIAAADAARICIYYTQ